MRFPRWFTRNWDRWQFRAASRRSHAGIEVGILLPVLADEDTLRQKVAAAIDLLERYDPRVLQRMRTFCVGILIFGDLGPKGRWSRHARLIELSERHIADGATQAAHVAGTLVHEVTHAWLEARGFEYRLDRRRRIEAVCYRAEAAFLRRLPGGDAAAAYYEERAAKALTDPQDAWSDEAFRRRAREGLVQAGVPAWLIKLLEVSFRRRAA